MSGPDITAVLSRLLREPVDPFAAGRKETAQGPEKPAAPEPPSPPAVFARPPESGFQGYQAAGRLARIGAFEAAAAALERLPESTGGGPEAAARHAGVARVADQLHPNLMAQLFPFFKENLRTRDEERRRRHETVPEITTGAEEQALELLESILDMAEQADDLPAFLLWLDERLQVMEWELVKRLGNLPAESERMFQLVRQAAEALAHGVPPAHIRERLQEEIARKKDLKRTLEEP